MSDCGCAYEDVDWNGQTVRRYFHDPECGTTPTPTERDTAVNASAFTAESLKAVAQIKAKGQQ